MLGDIPVNLHSSADSSSHWKGPLDIFWSNPPAQIMPTLNLFTQDLIQSKYEYLQDRESTTFLGSLFQFSSTFKVKMLSFNLV